MLSDFLDSLGSYVYGYKNPKTDKWDYIGKGVFNRCLVHVKDKDLSKDDLYIISKNLERFEYKNDAAQFALESYLISSLIPSYNKVDGHYKECFVMAKFSELFDEYKALKHDNFEALPQWYISNYEKFKNNVNVLTIKGDNIYMESKTRETIQLSFYVDTEQRPTSVRFAIWQKGDKFQERLEQLYVFLESSGYTRDMVTLTGQRQIYEVPVDDIASLIELFDDFMG